MEFVVVISFVASPSWRPCERLISFSNWWPAQTSTPGAHLLCEEHDGEVQDGGEGLAVAGLRHLQVL